MGFKTVTIAFSANAMVTVLNPVYRGGGIFFSKPGLKLDERSIENGLEGQECLVMNFCWGGCHRPNRINSRVPRNGISGELECDMKL